MIDAFHTIIIIIFTLLGIISLNIKETNKVLFLSFLYFYHLFFAFIYYKRTSNHPSDSLMYYFSVLQDYDFNIILICTGFIENITYLLTKYIGLLYLNTTFLFAISSFIGFYLLYNLMKIKFNKSNYLVLVIIGAYFWTDVIVKQFIEIKGKLLHAT